MSGDLGAAAEIMALATSGFVQEDYAVEGLEALVAAGWRLAPPAERPEDSRDLLEFRTTGLLWLINRVVFHPRGFAIAFDMSDDGEVVGWSLLGDGAEVWRFSEKSDDQHFAEVEALLTEARGLAS